MPPRKEPLILTCRKCSAEFSTIASRGAKWCAGCRNKMYKRNNKPAAPEYMRRYHLLRKYGLTPAQHDQMLLDHEGRCAICRTDAERLVVDHCHETGAVRGLLCTRCNLLMGFVDAGLVPAALAYKASLDVKEGM